VIGLPHECVVAPLRKRHASLLPKRRPASSDPPYPRTQRSRIKEKARIQVFVIAVAHFAPSAPHYTGPS
jgi:hypothetical protein